LRQSTGSKGYFPPVFVKKSKSLYGFDFMDSLLFMKAFITILLVLEMGQSLANHRIVNKCDTSKPASVHGQLTIASFGFAPLPATSFERPIVSGFLAAKKGRFIFGIDFTAAMNTKAWLYNTSIRYNIINGRKWNLQGAVNGTLFFNTAENEKFTGRFLTNKITTGELSVTRQLSSLVSISASYQHIISFDKEAFSGDFVRLASHIETGKNSQRLSIALDPAVFCLNFNKNIRGLFFSIASRISYRGMPISLTGMIMPPIRTSFDCGGAKWSVGMSYSF
jgi:hypothetical protein